MSEPVFSPFAVPAEIDSGPDSFAPVATRELDPPALIGLSDEPVAFTPEELRESERRIRYTADWAAGRRPFQTAEPTPAEMDYATWLRDTGRLKTPDGPGFFAALGHSVVSVAAGVGELGIETYRYEKAHLTGTDQDRADADAREEALLAVGASKLKSMYEALGAGAVRLGGKLQAKVFGTLAEYAGDPAFRARVQRSDDESWYRFMRKQSVIAQEAELINGEAGRQAARHGWSYSGLETATDTASFVADPVQYLAGPASSTATRFALRTSARAFRATGRTLALGAADALRAEVVGAASRIATLEQTTAHLAQLGSEEGRATFEVFARDLVAARAQQAAREVQLRALDQSNREILATLGRPAFPARAAATAGVVAAEGMEAAGRFLEKFNTGVVDRLVSGASTAGEGTLARLAARTAPTAVAGGVIGAATADEGEGLAGFGRGLVVGAVAPTVAQQAGRLVRIFGETYLIGGPATEYAARLATDARAAGLEKWAFRQLDQFTPAFDVARRVGGPLAHSAAVGAGLGYVASGGEETDLGAAAASGVAGHFAPWGVIPAVHGLWRPVRSPGEYEATLAANLRLLRDRWAGTDNRARLDALTPSQQLEVASVVAANPDAMLRLIGRDDAAIHAATARGAAGETVTDLSQIPGLHYQDPATGRSVLVLNPAHPAAMRPVLAHEFWHKAQVEGLAAPIVRELLGDAGRGTPGFFTARDAAQQPVRRADGSFATTADFQSAKAAYAQRLAERGVRRELTDAEFALEHASEQGADYVMSGRFDESLRPAIGSLVARLLPEAVRQAVGASGSALGRDGAVRGSMGLGLPPSPGVQKLLDAYLRDWRVGRNRPGAASQPRTIDLSHAQRLKVPALLDALDGSLAVRRDATGRIAGTAIDPATGRRTITDPAQVFRTPEEIAQARRAQARAVLEAVRAARDTAADPHAVTLATDKQGRETATGRRLTPETLQALAESPAFTPPELDRLRELNGLTDPATADRTPARFLYETPGTAPGEASGVWHEEQPATWRISADDGVAYTTTSPERLAKAVDTAWAENRDAVSALWTSPVTMFADAQAYATHVATANSGELHLSPTKRAALREALGIEDSSGSASPTSTERFGSLFAARQLDQTHRLARPEKSDSVRSRGERARFTAGSGENQSSPDVGGSDNGSKLPKRSLSRGETFSDHIDPTGGGIYAELKDDGLVEFCIQRSPSTPRGAEMFGKMLEAYGQNLAGIRGVWLGYGQLRDNFDSFHAAMKKGLSPEEAALATFTGKMAYRAGFTKIKVVKVEKDKVVVEFTK